MLLIIFRLKTKAKNCDVFKRKKVLHICEKFQEAKPLLGMPRADA